MTVDVRQALVEKCDKKKHATAMEGMGPRDVDLQAFRSAAQNLLLRLDGLGPNTKDPGAEQKRQDLMNTLKGALSDSDCDQTMIAAF